MTLTHTTFGDITLHQHQVAAVEWMMERETDPEYPGGFLCDEMGLGKTITLLALLLNKTAKRTLLLGPLAVLNQWVEALSNADIPVFTLSGSEWKQVRAGGSGSAVYLTNYDKLTTAVSAFGGVFDRLVCDEAHVMRNPESARVEQLMKIKATFKWFVTGTPIVNRREDFGTLLKVLNPARKDTMIRKKEVRELAPHLVLQRTQADIRALLPGVLPKPPRVVKHRLEFTTAEEQKFYRGVQGILQGELEEIMAHDIINMGMFMTLLLRLRQISVHPQVYIRGQQRAGMNRPSWAGDSTKVDALRKVLASEKDPHGFVVFCHFKDEMVHLKEMLKRDLNVAEVLEYDGSMSAAQRARVIERCRESVKRNDAFGTTGLTSILDQVSRGRVLPLDVIQHVIAPFVGGRHTVLLAQIQSAGTGLNLQFMDRVVFTTPWWTAALMDQAVGRVLRLGQKKQVVVHHLELAEEQTMSLNIDDFINDRVELKRKLCTELLTLADHRVAPTAAPIAATA